MKRPFLLLLLLLLLPVTVIAHTETEPEVFGWTAYFVVVIIVAFTVGISLAMLKRYESKPGTLPIRKLGIAAGVTVMINAILFAVVYMEV